MAFFPDANAIIRDPLKAQYSDIMSEFPSKGGISPLYESAVENWNPTAWRNYPAQMANMLTGSAGSANPDIPLLQGGIHVTPLAEDPSDFQKVDWARTFQHELMHPRFEYEKKDPVLSKYGVGVGRNKPNLAFGDEATSATNPGYGGEEQWNYMHDLMYGPRYDFEGGKGPETLVAGDQLRARGLIEPGMETYTPKAYDVIGKSGLTSEMKKVLGFGVNPFEDTRAAGQWHRMQQEKRKEKGIKQVEMQRQIRAAEGQRAAANQVRQNIQTYGNRDRPNTGINRPGGGYGQSPTGGDVAGTPFSRGGILGAF